ncbi:pseudouridylate synthase [Chitinophaga sp. Cy-1792]|uniref:pseudouridylate synthase n=1 Tax=Chitinophaga sp. Cy-1792 TaxID=2608339 RepID=UPI001964934D|nr:pseudouridylate synthase [Chitinophaga sp. Cy-1792]
MINVAEDGHPSASELKQATGEAFCLFKDQTTANIMADGLSFSPDADIHPLCKIAAAELQQHLLQQTEWNHNFGLGNNGAGAIIGKMFGVLVVRNQNNELGYLAAFSGKLANGNHHNKFVAPIFDGLKDGGFLNAGMTHLTEINREIAALQQENTTDSLAAAAALKETRKAHSNALQRKIHEQYNFRNKAGQYKNLIDIFINNGYKQPPAGAGECAGPKLLQYAWEHKMEALALAEFWWGQSPKSATWVHGAYYKPCKEKCEPILGFMLSE